MVYLISITHKIKWFGRILDCIQPVQKDYHCILRLNFRLVEAFCICHVLVYAAFTTIVHIIEVT